MPYFYLTPRLIIFLSTTSTSPSKLRLRAARRLSLKRITIPILKKNKDASKSTDESYLSLETDSPTRTDDIFLTSSYQNELNEEQVHMATPPKSRKRSSADSGYSSRRLSSFWEELIRQKKEKRQKEDSIKDNVKPLKSITSRYP